MSFRQVSAVKVPPGSITARRRFIEYHARRGVTSFRLSGRAEPSGLVIELERRGWSAWDSREHDGYSPNRQTGHMLSVYPKEH